MRKEFIKLSEGKSQSLYTGEPGAPWMSMEVYGLDILGVELVVSEKLCMSLRKLMSQFADLQCIGDFLPGHKVTARPAYERSDGSMMRVTTW